MITTFKFLILVDVSSIQSYCFTSCISFSLKSFQVFKNFKKYVYDTETHDGCDPDWLWYNGHCYYYEYSAPQAFQQAENTCVQMGAHLVSILSNEENAFVSGFLFYNKFLTTTACMKILDCVVL